MLEMTGEGKISGRGSDPVYKSICELRTCLFCEFRGKLWFKIQTRQVWQSTVAEEEKVDVTRPTKIVRS